MRFSRVAVALAVAAGTLCAACSTFVAGAAKPEPFAPREGDKDPSVAIEGVVRVEYPVGTHAEEGQRVAYDRHPPFGGAHDATWADCAGTVYPAAVRTEHMVHSLEHGAIWIAYNPDQVKDAALDKLKSKVEGQPDMMLSPYPGLDRPISLQSWGHQLKLDDAGDERIDLFIKALRRNPYQTPEPRGRCDSVGVDPANAPPFDPTPPGPDAMPVEGR